MWSRETIKNYAKNFLREHYWKAFLVCLIASIFTVSNSSNNNNNNQSRNTNLSSRNQIVRQMEKVEQMESRVFTGSNNIIVNNANRIWRNSPIRYIWRGTSAIIFLIFTLILITVGYALQVGRSRFFLKGFKEDVGIGNLFSTFNSREYWIIVKTQFLRNLYNVLWTLLLIIPGIIKSYEYSMVAYILAEEPNLGPNEIITKSRRMTDGHKFDMFVLDISFWGWYILGSIFWGLGVFFVNPYKEATYAKLYNIISGNDNADDNIILE